MSFVLLVSPAAREDLLAIYCYSRGRWGQAKADAYLERIKDLLWQLTEQPEMGADRSELLPGIRCLPIASHSIFYQLDAEAIQILRILHGRQDPGRNLI